MAKEKIQYSDDLAAEIIKKWALKPEVAKVWKTRGTIPSQYFCDDFDQSERLKDTDSEYQKMKHIFQDPRIATTKFRTLGLKAADVWRGKDRMTQNERIGLKTEITELRNMLAAAIKYTSETNIRKIMSDARLHPTLIIGRHHNRVKQSVLLTDAEKMGIKIEFMSLYNFLKL